MGKYLKFYKECLRYGFMPNPGLCYTFRYDPLFQLIDPERGEMISYWGHDGDDDSEHIIRFEFTPLRQNIVLLMAAMNNEL